MARGESVYNYIFLATLISLSLVHSLSHFEINISMNLAFAVLRLTKFIANYRSVQSIYYS